MNFKMGVAWARKGERLKAHEVLDYLLERRKRRYVPASMIADVYANLAEREKALDWLDTAYQERDYFLTLLDRGTDLRELYDEPRFIELRRKMNLPPKS